MRKFLATSSHHVLQALWHNHDVASTFTSEINAGRGGFACLYMNFVAVLSYIAYVRWNHTINFVDSSQANHTHSFFVTFSSGS